MEKVENNIIIQYVGGEGYYPDEPHIVAEWQEWTDRGALKKVWRPNLLHAGHGIPYLYSRQLYRDFQRMRQNGAMLATDFYSLRSGWGEQGLNDYVLAELHH